MNSEGIQERKHGEMAKMVRIVKGPLPPRDGVAYFDAWVNFMEHDCTIHMPGRDDVSFPRSGFVIRLTSKEQTHLRDMPFGSSDVTFPVYQPQHYVDFMIYKTDEACTNSAVEPPMDFLKEIMWQNGCNHMSIIVSSDAAKFLSNHFKYDVWLSIYAPDSGPDSAVRDGKGAIKAVRRLNSYF